MRKVETIMGMPISIDIPGTEHDDDFIVAFARFRDIDKQFSPYKQHSELSRYRGGQLTDSELSATMKDIQVACAHYATLTEGYFSAYYNGSFDPTGYIKGWAIQEVGALLTKRGILTYLINAAGDILAASATGKQWQLGIQHPQQSHQTIGTVVMSNGGLATSGIYQRGNHIFNPHLQQVTNELLSATVYGNDVVMADVLATTCVAMGSKKALNFMKHQNGYEALLIDANNKVFMTSSFIPPKMQIAQ